jgi:hypothetical protein
MTNRHYASAHAIDRPLGDSGEPHISSPGSVQEDSNSHRKEQPRVTRD